MTKHAVSFQKCFENGVTGDPIATTFIPGLTKTVIRVCKFTWGGRDIIQINVHAQEHTARCGVKTENEEK